jgi:hypothetical protein
MAINMLERSRNVKRLFWLLPTLCGCLAGDLFAAFRAETSGSGGPALLASQAAQGDGGGVLLGRLLLPLSGGSNNLEGGHVRIG